MKMKKKAKWIRKAMKEFQEYEEQVVDFKAKHPEFNPPSVKSFLTQEEQKILGEFLIGQREEIVLMQTLYYDVGRYLITGLM